MNILVTGGAGFIGSALVRHLIEQTEHRIINVDKLTYAGSLDSIKDVSSSGRYVFEQVDICDKHELQRVFSQYCPDAVMHLAAESHVDRSIDGSSEFIQTNIVGSYILLETSRTYWAKLSVEKKKKFRFLHVSTDEVFGDLDTTHDLFTEETPYAPSSPYSASKASSDHLVRAWHRTYGLPVLITNCSNNYGPYQFPEKLIPLIILNALKGKPLPVYGDGAQVRDWLHVDDHVSALYDVLRRGEVGETYNVGGNNEKSNLEVVRLICSILDEMLPVEKPCQELITHVADRLGHDRRYAIDAKKINCKLGWLPKVTFEIGLRETINWYLNNSVWVERIKDRNCKRESLVAGAH